MEPTTDPVAFTREHLQLIAEVWIETAKRTLMPYVDKVPAPIARYVKARTGMATPAAGDAAA